MRTTQPRHVIRLRITILGTEPEVWRMLTIDESLSVADLHDAIQLCMGWSATERHVFGDRDPFPHGYPPTDADVYDDCAWYRATGPYGGHPGRRWGDRWTMIDWRDPDVIDEKSTSIQSALHATNPLYYACRSEERWWFRIDAVADEVIAATAPPVGIEGGCGRAPFEGDAGARTHSERLRVFGDPTDPDHVAVRAALDRTVGPWARFDPAECDLSAVQRDLEARWGGSNDRRQRGETVEPGYAPNSGIARLVAAFPATNREGLRRHLAQSGALMPSIVTRDDAAEFIAPLAWLVERAGTAGIPLSEGAVSPEVLSAWAGAVGSTVERMPPLLATARRFGLVYPRLGRLHATKAAIAALDDPIAMWHLLATTVLERRVPGTTWEANALLLLAIVDGSLDDPDAGLARIAAAADIAGAMRWSPEGWGRHGYGDHYGDLRAYGIDRLTLDRAFPPRTTFDIELDAATQADRAHRQLSPFVDVLEPLGIDRGVDETWTATPLLREFARATLQAHNPWVSNYDDPLF